MLKMKILWMLFGLGLMFGAAQGLKCRDCYEGPFKGEPYQHTSCFDKPSENMNSLRTCSFSQYCITEFTLEDGLPMQIHRSCKDPKYDHDTTTDDMPTKNECHTDFYSTGYTTTENTICYYACNGTDNCNDLPTTKSLMVCPSNCSQKLYQGYCDYLTGTCVCNEGYLGADCSKVDAVQVRKCVQCNNETDGNCLNPQASQGTTCGNKETRCSISQTQTFNKNGEIEKTTIVRGCTDNSVSTVQCAISDTSDNLVLSDHTEYTCSRVCDSDNCNIGLPNDLLDTSNDLYCSQCASCGNSLVRIPSRTLCPTGSNYCVSNVQYLFSEGDTNVNQGKPIYKLLRHERGCATKAVENPGCKTSTIPDSNLTKVTCQESCQGNGCNNGWPGRKRCAQCTGSSTSSSFDSCLLSAQNLVKQCSYPYQEYCYSTERRVEAPSQVNDFMWDVARDCSYKPVENGCKVTTIDNVSTKQCNNSCTEDGCNTGLFSHAPKTLGSIATMFIAMWIGCFLRG